MLLNMFLMVNQNAYVLYNIKNIFIIKKFLKNQNLKLNDFNYYNNI